MGYEYATAGTGDTGGVRGLRNASDGPRHRHDHIDEHHVNDGG